MPSPTLLLRNEIQERIIQSTCEYYGMTEDQFITNKTTRVALTRFVCMYLIKSETLLNNTDIGKRLGRKHNAVTYGINQIAFQVQRKHIYKQTFDDIKKISKLAGLSCD